MLGAFGNAAVSPGGGPLITSVGYMLRYHDMVDHLRDRLIESEKQGRPPCVFLGRYAAAYQYILSPAFWDRRLSGGPIIEQATHFVDLARYLLGEIDLESVVASQISAGDTLGNLSAMPRGRSGRGMDEDVPSDQRIARVTLAQWRFTSGALGCLAHSALLHGKTYDTELEVLADGLHAVLTDPYSDACQLQIRSGGFRSAPVPADGMNDPYLAEMEAFISAIREGRPELARSPYQDAAKTFEVTCRITAAAMR